MTLLFYTIEEGGESTVDVYDFGLRLKKLREKKNYSQAQAAKRVGVSRSTMSAYERNLKTPRLETLIEIARLYGASVDYILGLEDRPYLYLDDLSDSQQKTIMDVVERLKREFKRHHYIDQ